MRGCVLNMFIGGCIVKMPAFCLSSRYLLGYPTKEEFLLFLNVFWTTDFVENLKVAMAFPPP